MRRLLLVPAAAAALLLAGCAQAGPAADGGSTGSLGSTAYRVPGSSLAAMPPGSVTVPRLTDIAPIAPGEPAQVGAVQIDATAVPGGYTGRMTLDLEGTGLTVTGTEGSCSAATAELLGQDAARVSVRLVVTRTSEGPCTAIAKLVPLTVTLAQPLGTRTVVLSLEQR